MSGVETSLAKSRTSLKPHGVSSRTTTYPLHTDDLPSIQDEPINVELDPESTFSDVQLASIPPLRPVYTPSERPVLDGYSCLTSPTSATSSAPSAGLIHLLSDLEPSSNESTPCPRPSQQPVFAAALSHHTSIASPIFHSDCHVTQISYDEPINVQSEPSSTPDAPKPGNRNSWNVHLSKFQPPPSNVSGESPIDSAQARAIDKLLNVGKGGEAESVAGDISAAVALPSSTPLKRPAETTMETQKKRRFPVPQNTSSDGMIEKAKISPLDQDTKESETSSENVENNIPNEFTTQQSTENMDIHVPQDKQVDSRYDKSAIVFKNGVHMVPKACYRYFTFQRG